MAVVRTSAVVLRRIPFGESSWIVHALSESEGSLGMLARGARRKGSPLASGVEPLTLSEIVVSIKPGRDLQNLMHASPLESHPRLAHDLERQTTALACAEATLRFLREGGAAPGVFERLREALGSLERGEPCAPALWRYLAGIADELGWGLALDHCAQCGSEDVERSLSVSVSAGGFLCQDCARANHAPSLSIEVARSLRETASRVPPAPREREAGCSDSVEDILYEHLCRHAGIQPRLEARALLRTVRR